MWFQLNEQINWLYTHNMRVAQKSSIYINHISIQKKVHLKNIAPQQQIPIYYIYLNIFLKQLFQQMSNRLK